MRRSQRVKETHPLAAAARHTSRRSPTISSTSITFGPSSLRLALEREGFGDVRVMVGAPEMPDGVDARTRIDQLARRVAFRVARELPGGAYTPLAFNLQAYGRRG